MKKVLAWLLRILCLVVIGLAVFTLVRCILHMNDDHSEAALLDQEAYSAQSAAEATATAEPLPEESAAPAVEENPTIELKAESTEEEVTVTATFRNIINSVQADLQWSLDGVVAAEETQRLLVEGTTATRIIAPDENGVMPQTVELTMTFGGKTVSASVELPGNPPEEEPEPQPGENVIQTAEIPVTCLEDCTVYSDSALTEDAGAVMTQGETGYLLDFEYPDEGLDALYLQFSDGTNGWVSARRCEITEEDCTVDEDYSQAEKEYFVNTMGYDSDTRYLIWVSLYTQKVNVFSGEKGNWTLEKTFDCASGANRTPTITGAYQITTLSDRWDLGSTYVAPVLVFHGGIAFTSQPYSAETDEIADDTMGTPVSGGSVRLEQEGIEWLYENTGVNTRVIVF